MSAAGVAVVAHHAWLRQTVLAALGIRPHGASLSEVQRATGAARCDIATTLLCLRPRVQRVWRWRRGVPFALYRDTTADGI